MSPDQTSHPSVVILTQYYVPESGAPQNRWHSLATHLVALGHSVTVLTAMPNYPTGRIFDGYRGRLFCREQIDGVQVLRTWLLATRSKSLSKRMLNYLSFGWMAFWYGLATLRGSDILIWESPPLFLGPFAVALAWLKRARCVMNVSDLWPESAVALGLVRPDSLATRLAGRLEMWLYRHSRAITGQTQGIVTSIAARVPQVPVRLFPNGVDLSMFQPAPPDPRQERALGLEGKFVVGYAGVIGYAQALTQVLEAAALLGDEPGVFFAIFGDGPLRAELSDRAARMGLSNLKFFGRQDRSAMPSIISLWDVGLVPLADRPLFEGARPSKMFELMGQGKPILFCGRGEGADIVSRNGCGIVIEPERPEQLADAVRQLLGDRTRLEEMGRRSRQTAECQFDRAPIARQISSLFEEII